MSEPGDDEVEARLRELAEAKEVVTATGRRLQQRLDELDAREATMAEREHGLDERERSLEARERALKATANAAAAMRRRLESGEAGDAEAEPPPSAAASVPARSRGGGGYNVERLERLVEDNAERFPERAEEWRSYVFFLREHAEVGGALPSSFDYLVDEVFAPLLR